MNPKQGNAMAALVGANHFEDRFCANKKSGIGGSERA